MLFKTPTAHKMYCMGTAIANINPTMTALTYEIIPSLVLALLKHINSRLKLMVIPTTFGLRNFVSEVGASTSWKCTGSSFIWPCICVSAVGALPSHNICTSWNGIQTDERKYSSNVERLHNCSISYVNLRIFLESI